MSESSRDQPAGPQSVPSVTLGRPGCGSSRKPGLSGLNSTPFPRVIVFLSFMLTAFPHFPEKGDPSPPGLEVEAGRPTGPDSRMGTPDQPDSGGTSLHTGAAWTSRPLSLCASGCHAGPRTSQNAARQPGPPSDDHRPRARQCLRQACLSPGPTSPVPPATAQSRPPPQVPPQPCCPSSLSS